MASEAITPDEKIKLLVESIRPASFERLLRDAADSFYEKLLCDVQDYLRENAEFNLQSNIDSLRAHNRNLEEHLQRLCAALGVGRYDSAEQMARIEYLNQRAEQVQS